MPSLVWCYAKMVKKPSLNDEKLMKLATIALHYTIGLEMVGDTFILCHSMNCINMLVIKIVVCLSQFAWVVSRLPPQNFHQKWQTQDIGWQRSPRPTVQSLLCRHAAPRFV